MIRYLNLAAIVLTLLNSSAQTCEVIIRQADSLFSENNLVMSGNLYHRADFFCGLGSNQTRRFYQSVAATGSYAQADRVADLALARYPGEPWIDSLLFTQVFLDLKNMENLAAFNRLQLLGNTDLGENKSLYHSLFGVVMFQFNKNEQAMEHWKKAAMMNDKDTGFLIQLEKDLHRISKRHHPTKAAIMSSVLPGLGQTWNGDVVDGLRSLTVVGGLAFVTVRTAIRFTWLEAVLGVVPWTLRYYRGGILNAQKQAIERRTSKRNEKLDAILDYLSE